MGFEDICTAGTGGTPLFGGVLGADWKVVVFLGLLTTLGCVVVLYMVANFLRHAKLIAWAQNEMFQVIATGLIAVFIVALISGLCSFPTGFLDDRYVNPDGTHKNIYTVADEYLTWGEQLGKRVFVYTLIANYYVGLTTAFHFNFDPLNVGSKMAPLGAFSQVSNLMSVMMSTFMVSYLVLSTQQLIIEYIRLAMPYFFLPLGLLLRALAPTREFGGAMVGLAISLLVFYPLVIVFNDMLLRQPIMDSLNSMNVFEIINANRSVLTTMLMVIAGLASAFSAAIGILAFVSQIVTVAMRVAVYYFFVAVMMPIFNFILLIGIAKAVSKLFGEEVDVTNLTRMI